MSIFGRWPERESSFLAPGEPVWVFGTGSFGRAVARACASEGVDVQGFVQTEPFDAFVDGLPVRSWRGLNSIDRDMSLLLGIFNRDIPIDSLVRLVNESGCDRVVYPWDLHAQFPKELGWRYWLANSNLLRAHAADLNRSYERLADERSRTCLKRLVDFRLGLDIDYASFVDEEAQYFNELTLPHIGRKELNYLDGGAYDGETFRQLFAKTSVNHAWLLEPDSTNYSKLTGLVRSLSLPGSCLPLALGDGYRLSRFSSGLGEAGHLNESGDQGIATVAVDDLLAGQNVDFIKLDVEGAEEAALRGAARTIESQRPVLALSCYHHPTDLWRLPDFLSELAPGYRLFLRQHTYNSFDLVLYGIPE